MGKVLEHTDCPECGDSASFQIDKNDFTVSNATANCEKCGCKFTVFYEVIVDIHDTEIINSGHSEDSEN